MSNYVHICIIAFTPATLLWSFLWFMLLIMVTIYVATFILCFYLEFVTFSLHVGGRFLPSVIIVNVNK